MIGAQKVELGEVSGSLEQLERGIKEWQRVSVPDSDIIQGLASQCMGAMYRLSSPVDQSIRGMWQANHGELRIAGAEDEGMRNSWICS